MSKAMKPWPPGEMPPGAINAFGDRAYTPRANDVRCPCCKGKASKARPEGWYHDRVLVKKTYIGGICYWECQICRNKRWVSLRKAAAFILTYL